MEAKIPSNASYTWRSIMSARDLISKGARKLVGNGSSINIWRDPWVPNLPDFKVASDSLDVDGAPRYVSELWCEHSWDLRTMERWFDSLEIKEICSIPIPLVGKADGWSWHHSKDGNYTVRSAYNLLTVQQHQGKPSTSISKCNVDWKSLWKAGVPPKIRIFAWKAINEAVPSRENLGKRGMIGDTICPMCGEKNESTLHMLLECDSLGPVWLYSPLRLNVASFQGSNFREWYGAAKKIIKEDQWWSLFWSLIWGVWLRRNDWVFNGKKRRVEDVISKATSMVGEFELAQNITSTGGVQKVKTPSAWCAPSQGVIKVNSDAAIFKDGKVGLGGVMRDFCGDVVVSTCRSFMGNLSVDVAEAVSMRHYLIISMEAGFSSLCLETDCLKLYKSLVRSFTPASEFGRIVEDILQISKKCSWVSFSFVRREGNCVAHELAKLSAKFDDTRVWLEEVHEDVISFVFKDYSLLRN